MPYLEIIPLRKLPPWFQFLDYEITNEQKNQIKIGQLIKVPFKGQDVLAIVTKLKNNTLIPQDKIKKIENLSPATAYLTNNQLILFSSLAKYYYLSPTLFIKSLVPKPPQRISKTKKLKINKINYNLHQKIPLEKILNNQQSIFLHYQNNSDRLVTYLSLAKKFFYQKKQILLITPTKKEAKEIYGFFLNYFKPEQLAYLSSELTNQQLYDQWQKIKNQQILIIIGTKIAVFAPFINLRLIIIDNEHHPSHQQTEINPRYNVKIAAKILLKIFKSQLIYCSFAPSLEIYWQIKNKKIKFLTLKSPKISPPPLIIDLKQERQAGNYQVFANETIEIIKNNLKTNQKTLLFINRRGYANLISCQDCGLLPICPNCQIPLIFHQQDNLLHCHYCDFTTTNWLKCPACQGPNLKQKGVGTEKLKQELEKIFFNKSIIIFDKDYQNINKVIEAKIIIGTKLALENLVLENFKTIVVVIADQLFYQGDFRLQEENYQLLKSLTIYPASRLVIQTYAPENYAIKYLFEPTKFYLNELLMRKKYNYPPFCQLAKLILQNSQEKLLINEVMLTYQKLKLLTKKFSDLQIIGPITPFRPKVRKNFRRFIILKYYKETTLVNIQKLIYNKKIILEKSPQSLFN